MYRASDPELAALPVPEGTKSPGPGHEAFGAHWAKHFPNNQLGGEAQWTILTPFFDFPREIRKEIYMENVVESINAQLRKVTKHRGNFPTPDAVRTVLYLAMTKASEAWTRPIPNSAAPTTLFPPFSREGYPLDDEVSDTEKRTDSLVLHPGPASSDPWCSTPPTQPPAFLDRRWLQVVQIMTKPQILAWFKANS